MSVWRRRGAGEGEGLINLDLSGPSRFKLSWIESNLSLSGKVYRLDRIGATVDRIEASD